MTVIAASSVKVATLVDGTLRVTMDVEPKDAKAAFELFGRPGVPMALAALKPARAEPRKSEVGPVCQWAVLRCQDPVFRGFLGARDEEEAKAIICKACGIESRKELDTDERALEVFHKKFRLGYVEWQRQQAVTT
jgi:hypothetical protein